jgi:hypothetical protein
MRPALRITCIVAIIFIAAGCATTTTSKTGYGTETPKALDVSSALKFEDVPVPSGFRAIANESFSFQNEVVRAGVLKYSGKANADQVVNFYKDQMPLYNWRLLNIVEYGRRIMNFDREDQTCVIVAEPTSLGTLVTITVGPKAGRSNVYKSAKTEDEGYKYKKR